MITEAIALIKLTHCDKAIKRVASHARKSHVLASALWQLSLIGYH